MGTSQAKELNKTLKQLERDQNGITAVNLPYMGIDDAIVTRIASALEHSNSITSVDLRRNAISSVGSRTLANVIGKRMHLHQEMFLIRILWSGNSTTITELNIRDNNIGDLGVLELARALRENTVLETLHLNGTNMEVGLVIFRSLATHIALCAGYRGEIGI